MSFCTSCGTALNADDAFCTSCGARVSSPYAYQQSGAGENVNQMAGAAAVSAQGAGAVTGTPAKKSELSDYLKYCWNNGHRGIVIFFVILTCFSLGGAIPITKYFLSEKGQKTACKIAGAKPVVRKEHDAAIRQPAQELIRAARDQGLDLPDRIEIYVMQSQMPVAYAIGRNSLVISESLAEYPELFASKVMFELHRIHNKASNLMPLMLASNLLVVILAGICLGVASFQAKFGDTRKSFWTGSSEAKDGAVIYVSVLAIMLVYLGIVVLIIRGAVKHDVLAADRYVASQDRAEAHCLYLDQVTKNDNSAVRRILECGYPDVDFRIGAMQAAA